MTKPNWGAAALAAILAGPALAQDYGGSMPAAGVEILSLDAGSGAAVVADHLGDKYVCSAADKRTYVEIGDCKPIRLSARVGGYIEAQGKVLRLFERNDCALTYDQLKSALEKASEETREAVGEIMADMTATGGLIDDEPRGRAQLTVGDVCGAQ